jgi:hypothetical protein
MMLMMMMIVMMRLLLLLMMMMMLIKISLVGGQSTAEEFITDFYSDWNYDHAGGNIVALLIFIVVFRVLTYFALTYIDHSKR